MVCRRRRPGPARIRTRCPSQRPGYDRNHRARLPQPYCDCGPEAERRRDYECSISPQLVWSIRPSKQAPRLLEYKALARTWFRFPAWGGSLAEDAATRDLTINALYYDLRHDVLADPCGAGCADLLGVPRVARTPYRGDDPVEQACIILRCVKFKLRWPELDITAVADRVKLLPDDLVARIPGTDWDQRIVRMRKRCIPSRHRGSDELAIAKELGRPAVCLIVQLQARA